MCISSQSLNLQVVILKLIIIVIFESFVILRNLMYFETVFQISPLYRLYE